MSRTDSVNLAEAKAVIAGKQIESQQLLDLTKELKKKIALLEWRGRHWRSTRPIT